MSLQCDPDSMADAFVVMQIGDTALDAVYETAIVPAIERTGLRPHRIDRHNTGDLLKSEIVSYLQNSEIIVADLTNERPNCYLEVGYAMGLGRHRHLILTVRQDHQPGMPGYRPEGPKVHFDLAGYDLLFWDPEDLNTFTEQLAQRIQRRLAIVKPPKGHSPARFQLPAWANAAREAELPRLLAHAGPGFMELTFATPAPLEATQAELLSAARASTIDTFGWPIGVVFEDATFRPRPTGDGVRARIEATRLGEPSYDYWEIRVDGSFYLLQSLFEDQLGRTDELFVNTRVVRVTEGLLYCARIYEALGLPMDTAVRLRVTHGNIEGRTLSAPLRNWATMAVYSADVNEVTKEIEFPLGTVADRLPDLVQQLMEPLFQVFDFFALSPKSYARLVDAFVKGELL